MIKSKKTERLSLICITLAAILSILLLCHPVQEIHTPADEILSQLSDDYASLLFDDSYIHEINILISDLNWDYMTKHATEEQYVICDAVIDGEHIDSIAIRPKGNSSLSAISNSKDTHFSFKLEFNRYNQLNTFHGLDKLALGNLGQDPSCMKDFLVYHMMNKMGVPAPLSSYTLVKLNGEDFGLYLAVEAVEDSFCYRNYGEDFGMLYKPDSFAMDSLDLSAFLDHSTPDSALSVTESIMDGERYAGKTSGDRVDIIGDMINPAFASLAEQERIAALQYISDDPKDYDSIFNTAVFDITESDKEQLVESIRTLNTSDTPTDALDTESLLKFFAVHDFVNNYDSYNSFFVHNFYLHEKNGRLSLVPWDYNLAFGSLTYECGLGSILGDTNFNYLPPQGEAMSLETNMINYPIDTPTYSIPLAERPLINTLLGHNETLDEYHRYCEELLDSFFENGQYDTLFQRTYNQIRPYIEKGLTFYTLPQFEAGTKAMNDYCRLRAKSVRGQLNGSIPATMEGQQKDPEKLIQTGNLQLKDLVSFDSLLSGLDKDTLMHILQIILQDDYPYNTVGAVEAVRHYAAVPKDLAVFLPELMKIPVISEMAYKKMLPLAAVPIAMLILVAALFFTIHYRRRNYAAKA